MPLGLDSGRGGAELWTAGAVDREQHRQLSVAVRVSDAQGLAATHHLTVLVDDLNDNPMKPAAKAVYLWKTQVRRWCSRSATLVIPDYCIALTDLKVDRL